MMTNPVNNAKNADFVFLKIGRGSGKVFAFRNFIKKEIQKNPNVKFVIIRQKEIRK